MNQIEQLESTVAALQAHVEQQQRQIAALAKRGWRVRSRSLGAILGMCLALLFGAVALAAIPGADGLITGCYDTKSGALRVIDAQAGKTCEKSQQQLTWNQVGTQGPQGATGAQGPQGPQGETGAQGLPGIRGLEVVVSSGVGDGKGTGEATADVDCPAGKSVLGGGAQIVLDDPKLLKGLPTIALVSSNLTSTGWHAEAKEFQDVTVGWSLQVSATCANVTP